MRRLNAQPKSVNQAGTRLRAGFALRYPGQDLLVVWIRVILETCAHQHLRATSLSAQQVRRVEPEPLFAEARQQMLEQIALHTQLSSELIGTESLSGSVMEAMATVPRHEFVPDELRPFAYLDRPLPIGYGKTISQPFIVALMTYLLDLKRDDTVLDVGTGLGYQAAVLATLVRHVYSAEIVEELAGEATERLGKFGYRNVSVRAGDGCRTWASEAPFDKVLVAAAPELIPVALLNQLKPGGRMVIPCGLADSQQLTLVRKDAKGTTTANEILPVRFASLVVVH